MGYFKVENFDNSFEWGLDVINGGYVSITDNDFEHLQENEDKLSTIQLLFDKSYPYENTYINKKYYTPLYFKFKDIYGKDVLYNTLRITYNVCGTFTSTNGYKKPEDFLFSFGIKRDSKIIREWFLPICEECSYTNTDFDLTPLFENYNSFDEIFFNVLKHPGNVRVLLGSAFLLQDTDETHNIKLAISDLLHLKYKNFLTNLNEDAYAGDKKINVVGTSDVNKGTTIMLGEGDLSEVHTIRRADLTSDNTAILELMNEFDSDKIQYTWANRTPVYRAIPASIVEMRDAESIFPLFFISSEAFMNDESTMNNGSEIDSYVRDENGDHTVSVRRSWDGATVLVSINVFSDTPETASDMWRFLKSKVTSRDVLSVAGKEFQYIISGERDVSPEDAEILPNYVMDLTFYFRNNVYNRKYIPYPRFKSMAVTYEIKPVEAI